MVSLPNYRIQFQNLSPAFLDCVINTMMQTWLKILTNNYDLKILLEKPSIHLRDSGLQKLATGSLWVGKGEKRLRAKYLSQSLYDDLIKTSLRYLIFHSVEADISWLRKYLYKVLWAIRSTLDSLGKRVLVSTIYQAWHCARVCMFSNTASHLSHDMINISKNYFSKKKYFAVL